MKGQGGRRHYGRGLAADAVDVALWSTAGDGSTDGWIREQTLAFPLAMDAGARFGARALLVPAVSWVSGAVVHGGVGSACAWAPWGGRRSGSGWVPPRQPDPG